MAENIDFNLRVPKDDLNPKLDSASKKAGGLSDVLTIAQGVFTGQIATKALDLIVDGFDSVISIVGDAIKASAAQELAISNLNNALARAGNFSTEASKGLQAFASQLQSTTTFGDEVVLENLALLQSLTKLDKEGLQRATLAAADFATVLGVDLETATRLVAKAASGQVDALSRYGIQVQKGANDTETFNNVLDKLNANFGGASQAKLGTYSGAVAALNNSFGDLLEPIGDVFTQNTAIIASINVAKGIIEGFTSSLAENSGSLTNIIKGTINATLTFSEVVFDSFDGITRVTQTTFNALTAGFKTIIAGFVSVGVAASELIALIPGLESTGNSAAQGLQGTFNSLVSSIEQDAKDMDDAINGRNIFTQLSDGANNAKKRIVELSAELDVQAQKIKNQEVSNELSAADQKRLDNARAVEAEITSIRQTAELERENALNELLNQSITGEFERNEAEIQRIQDFEMQKLELAFQAQQAKIMAEKQGDEQRLALQKAAADKELAQARITNKALVETNRASNQQQLADERAFFSAATSLASSENKALAAIGKTAAIAEIAIRTPQAVASSFAFGTRLGGPPLGFTFGAIAATAMAAQAAKVAGVKGFANGGVIGGFQGASAGGDNAIATVRSGEMVLNASQQKSLFDSINNGGGNGDIVIQVDGREIARAVREQVRSGFALA